MVDNFDRFLPDWQLGSLTLTAGSVTFTATDAMLTLGAIREGDTIITPSGLTLVIESITDDNNGKLSSPCPPAAAGTYATRIRFQSDNSRYTGQVAALIKLLSGGNVSALGKLVLVEGDYLRASGAGVIGTIKGKNLDALAELVGAAGKIISFTDAETMVLLDVPPADTHNNLAQLAAIAKANDQFVIMGADGTIMLKSIKSLTDAIAENATAIGEKYTLPAGGTADQLLDATGAAIPKAGLPISEAAQKALSIKSSYNWIINGDFINNQRGGVKKPANGVYGFDRWKGHANGIEQIIEALPAGEYTLTWAGGGNGSFGGQTKASPIKATVVAGNTSVVVPATAAKVSVVAGDATSADPWLKCVRPTSEEEKLCYRYFCRITGGENWLAAPATGAGGAKAFVYLSTNEKMRTHPSVAVSGSASHFAGGWLNSTLVVDGIIGTTVICTVGVQSVQNPDGSPSWLVRLSSANGTAALISLDAEL